MIPLYTPGMSPVQKLFERKDQSLHRDPRHTGQGADARRHHALQPSGKADLPLYGLFSTFSNFNVLLEIAVKRKIREDAPFDKSCYIGCEVRDDGCWRSGQHRQGYDRARTQLCSGSVEFGLNVIQGARMQWAPTRSSVRSDLNDSKEEWGRARFGMTHFVNPSRITGRHCPASGHALPTAALTSPRLHRQHHSDAPGARGMPPRLGRLRGDRGRRRQCAKSPSWPFQLATGRVWKGTAFGGARGRTDVPKIA